MTLIHPIIREMADDDRKHDPWGAGMGALGAVCDVLHVEGGTIPTSAGYWPSMGLTLAAMIAEQDSGEYDRQRTLLAGLYPEDFPGFWVEGYEPNLTIADLEYAARVLDRYLDQVRLAGRDY